MRAMVALGGNAMSAADGRARPEDQIDAARTAMAAVAELLTRPDPVDIVITHGNGPQVGNLLVKNQLAAAVVPPVPLDWCGAQTQATIGFIVMNALDEALAARGATRRSAAVVTRVEVDPDDPGFDHPTKPVGRYVTRDEAEQMMAHGETWEDRGERGWRRVVASPQPQRIPDAEAISTLVAAGFVVVANGGGGIPVAPLPGGGWRGVEAVIDKDLGAALLGETIGVDVLVIATDVPNAVLRFGTPQAEPLGRVTVSELAAHAADGHFASGSMGPKVAAAIRFVRATGRPAVITDLPHISEAVTGAAGTVVQPDAGA